MYMSLVSAALFVLPALIISACYAIIIRTIWAKGAILGHSGEFMTSLSFTVSSSSARPRTFVDALRHQHPQLGQFCKRWQLQGSRDSITRPAKGISSIKVVSPNYQLNNLIYGSFFPQSNGEYSRHCSDVSPTHHSSCSARGLTEVTTCLFPPYLFSLPFMEPWLFYCWPSLCVTFQLQIAAEVEATVGVPTATTGAVGGRARVA